MLPQNAPHSFHIPVMGLGYTIDTPVKVAKYGISSVLSIMEDGLIEQMRMIHSRKYDLPFKAIRDTEQDYRARRITAYLNMLHTIVNLQIAKMRSDSFEVEGDLTRYFELLPASHSDKITYTQMLSAAGEDKMRLQELLRESIVPGSIDVNIMTKLDKTNYDKEGMALPPEFADAMSALRAFALSELNGAMVFSAGLNPRLFAYMEQFQDFFPDENGFLKKRIVLKVSDYRSALIQGKYLAKKGLWVSEFRIESGLNCGGHAFATEGILLGPILEEFKSNRESLNQQLWESCQNALGEKGKSQFLKVMKVKVTVQGGIGNANEDQFLINHYDLDGTGWGSPFLLVPEATNVDEETLQKLINAKKSDYYLSDSSPLGVPFNNLRTTSSEIQRKERIDKNRPGSPCYKKFLSLNSEFTEIPICSASRQYQHLKLKQLSEALGTGESYTKAAEKVMEKDCLCEGLGAPALLVNQVNPARNLRAVTICPGPNLAYYSAVFSLKEMVDHIYGKASVMVDAARPHMFVKELELYVSYLKTEMGKFLPEKPKKHEAYLDRFRNNLLTGIGYYQNLISSIRPEAEDMLTRMKLEILGLQNEIERLNAVEA